MSALDALIVGAGISGLAIAHCLSRNGLAVEVWEGSNRVGGKIRTVEKEGYRLEDSASMVMNFRSEIDQFMHSAGLESSKRERSSNAQRYLPDAGRLHEAPSDLSGLLRTPLFSTAASPRAR